MKITSSRHIKTVFFLVFLSINSVSFSQSIDPFLTDVWGGVNCVDNNGITVYPGNYYTPNHSSAGCVAISLSQILYYYKWPLQGVGSNVFSDNYNGVIKRHASFFETIQYDWDNMLDEYMGKASTEVEQKAVGELFYSAACALEMDFEPSGSTSNINKTPFVYQNFFRYSSHYEDVSYPTFWDKIKENILAGYPVPIAISANRTGDGHVVVANGYKEENGVPYYYLNWGWYNSNNINGWYNIQGWTTSSPGYNMVTGATFDIMPNPQITTIKPSGTGNDFTVSWEVSERINWNEFTLEQKVDEGNWTTVATGITTQSYNISNPSGLVYQFRVKSMINGKYYDNSWSEVEVYATQGGFDGFGVFGGSQYAYARQTPDNDLDFTADYTFETWIRLKDGNSNGNVIIDQQPVFGLEITDVTATDYAVEFISHTSNATLNSNASGSKLRNNEWVHVAVTHSGTTTKLFVNGVLRQQDSSSKFNLTTSNSALNIAERYNSGYSGFLKADLDEVRISNSARYTSNFSPIKDKPYELDVHTVLYLPFQNVHTVRLKDEASNLSVIVKNEPNYVEWFYETNTTTLSNEEFEVLDASLALFPNPVVKNRFQISMSNAIDLGEVNIDMYDLRGRKIKVTTSKSKYNTWDVQFNAVNPGIYVIQFRNNRVIASKKIIVK